jgi:hypothetical protein
VHKDGKICQEFAKNIPMFGQCKLRGPWLAWLSGMKNSCILAPLANCFLKLLYHIAYVSGLAFRVLCIMVMMGF